MPGKRRHPAENKQNSVESSKKIKREPVDLHDIPYGLPRELLEKILSYITEAKDISKVERVNKTFKNISWKSFTSFNLYDGTRLPESISQWFPIMWRKSENLKHLMFYGILHVPEFLLMVQRLNFEMPRNVETFQSDHRVSVCPVFPSLLEGWSGSVKAFAAIYVAKLDKGTTENCVFEMTAFALRKCSRLRKIDIDRMPSIDVSSIIASLRYMTELQELSLNSVRRGNRSDEFIEPLISSFQSIWLKRGNSPSPFRLTIHSLNFLGLGAALKQTPTQVELVTEISLYGFIGVDPEAIKRKTTNQRWEVICFALMLSSNGFEFSIVHACIEETREGTRASNMNQPCCAFTNEHKH